MGTRDAGLLTCSPQCRALFEDQRKVDEDRQDAVDRARRAEDLATRGLRQCAATNTKGYQCGQAAIVGYHLCHSHASDEARFAARYGDYLGAMAVVDEPVDVLHTEIVSARRQAAVADARARLARTDQKTTVTRLHADGDD